MYQMMFTLIGLSFYYRSTRVIAWLAVSSLIMMIYQNTKYTFNYGFKRRVLISGSMQFYLTSCRE